MYYLFFVDDKGSVGMDMIFFDFLGILKGFYGINEILKIFFCVLNDVVLDYWVKCFDCLEVNYMGI